MHPLLRCEAFLVSGARSGAPLLPCIRFANQPFAVPEPAHPLPVERHAAVPCRLRQQVPAGIPPAHAGYLAATARSAAHSYISSKLMSGFLLRKEGRFSLKTARAKCSDALNFSMTMTHGKAAGFGAQNFPVVTSLKMSIANSFSASTSLNRAFSFSKTLVRLDASAFSDPYWFSQRYQSRPGDMKLLDDLGHRASAIENLLAPA